MKQFRLDKRTGKRPTAKVTLRKTRLIRVATPRTAQRELNANKQKWRRRLCKSCLKAGDAELRDEFAEEHEDEDGDNDARIFPERPSPPSTHPGTTYPVRPNASL